MQPLPTKAQIRAQMQEQLQQFLDQGGAIAEIPRGISGLFDNKNLYNSSPSLPPRPAHTPLNDVIKDLDARKQGKLPLKPSKPRKKLITDDFGEPLRWVWVQEP